MLKIKIFSLCACLIFLIGCSAMIFPIDSENIKLNVRKQDCKQDSVEIEYKAEITVMGGNRGANNAICITKLDGNRYGTRESRKEQSKWKVLMYKTVDVPRDGTDHTFELCCAGGISLKDVEEENLGCKSEIITKAQIDSMCS